MLDNYEISESDIKNILEVVIAFSREKDYFILLSIILDKMMYMACADAGTLYIIEDDKLHFRILKNNTLKTYQSNNISLPPIVLDKNNIENVSAYAAIKNELVCVDDVYTDKTFNFNGPKNYDKLTGYRSCSMLVFPLSTSGHEVIGVVQLVNAVDRETGQVTSFKNTCNTELLLALASITANTLDNIIYAKEVDELFHSFVSVMTKAIDERSVYNVNHTKNVARYCGDFAEYLAGKFQQGHAFHFSENRRDQLVMSAYLHDIGKIITPLSVMDKADRLGERLEIIKLKFEVKKQQVINNHLKNQTSSLREINELNESAALVESVNNSGFLSNEQLERVKDLGLITYIDANGNTVPLLSDDEMESLSIIKGTLTAGERDVMQEHAAITGRLLDSMKFNKSYNQVSAWAKGHHECLDGTGYPLGLKGDDVSIEMCILAIIDIFDALTAKDRPYKKGMPIDKAHHILLSMAEEGKLHAELVNLFIESNVGNTNTL